MNNDSQFPRNLTIPSKLYFSKDIDSAHKFLYMYLSYRASTRGYIWYKNETLADNLGKEVTSIKRGLKALAEAKWIKIENRVKKGDLYHADLRRAIWIYSDYLVALDKGGYGVARPLEFRTWKKKFISALIDNTKIPQIMQFHPVVKKMGELEVYYDSNSKYLYAYTTDNHTTPDKKYSTRKLTAQESSEVYKKLYDHYCSLHQDKENENETNEIKDFNHFQSYIRSDYLDKTIIVLHGGVEVTVNALGMLMKINQDGKGVNLDADKAIEIWQWLFENQSMILDN